MPPYEFPGKRGSLRALSCCRQIASREAPVFRFAGFMAICYDVRGANETSERRQSADGTSEREKLRKQNAETKAVKPRILLFDMDETLLDFRGAEEAALKKTLARLGIEPDDAAVTLYDEINASQWRLLEKGELNLEQLKTRRFDLFFDRLGAKRSSKQAQGIYEKALSGEHELLPGALDILRLLSPGYDLYLVSNGVATVQEGRIQGSGIAPYFKDIFISERIGAHKPEKAFFDRCFARIPNFSPDEAMIIGDGLTSDILGGIRAGIATCWLNPDGKPARKDIKPDYEIKSLAQLPEILGK